MELKEPKAIEDMETIVDYAYYHRYRYLKYHEAFRAQFKRPLKDFWESNLFGFDLIAFDKWINPEQKRSCQEIVLEKYGQEAVEVIKDLL